MPRSAASLSLPSTRYGLGTGCSVFRYSSIATASSSGRTANWMCVMPARTAASADSRTPWLIAGGVLCTSSMLLLFLGVPRPSFSRSQFRRIHAGIRMATGAALPMLEAQVRVVEEHLAAALHGQLRLRTQRDQLHGIVGFVLQVHDGDQVAEIHRRVDLGADHVQAARAVDPAGLRP